MGNIFTSLINKLSKRRQKKGKPVPVVPVPVTVPAEPKLRAVTYNRVDGVVSGGRIEAVRPPVQQRPRPVSRPVPQSPKTASRRHDRDYDDEIRYAEVTTFSPEWYRMNEDASGPFSGGNSNSGSDYTPEPVSSSYVAPSTSYEGASYSAQSYSSDSGSGGSSFSSGSYSDSGSSSSSGGGYGGGE